MAKKYRPFTDEEIWVNPYILLWKSIKHKTEEDMRMIATIMTNKNKKIICNLGTGNKSEPIALLELFENYTFLDNTPIGKLI